MRFEDAGAAWLRPHPLFSAVVVRAGLLHAVLGTASPEESAAPLAELLDGPVFYSADACGLEAGYTVLLTVGAVRMWRMRGTTALDPTVLLLVPAPARQTPADGPWWVVPPDGPGALCTRTLLVSLLGRGLGHA